MFIINTPILGMHQLYYMLSQLYHGKPFKSYKSASSESSVKSVWVIREKPLRLQTMFIRMTLTKFQPRASAIQFIILTSTEKANSLQGPSPDISNPVLLAGQFWKLWTRKLCANLRLRVQGTMGQQRSWKQQPFSAWWFVMSSFNIKSRVIILSIVDGKERGEMLYWKKGQKQSVEWTEVEGREMEWSYTFIYLALDGRMFSHLQITLKIGE